MKQHNGARGEDGSSGTGERTRQEMECVNIHTQESKLAGKP